MRLGPKARRDSLRIKGRSSAKRKEKGLAPVGSVGKLALDAEREGFDVRQPQHISLAANLGLGLFEKVDHRVIEL